MSIKTDLIYNLVQHIRDEYPNETVFANERIKISGQVPERNILIRETGGSESEVLEEFSFQVIIKDIDNVNARELAYQVYETLQSGARINGRFGKILPSTIVKGNTIDEIQVARITALQRPESLGKDENGLSEFSMNFQLFI